MQSAPEKPQPRQLEKCPNWVANNHSVSQQTSTLKAIILIATLELCFGAGVKCEAKQVSLCCHADCVSVLIRSCFIYYGEKIAFTSRKAKGFIWHSLPGKQCPCTSGWAGSQPGLNCLQGRRHNITVNIRKHCNLLFAYNFIWQKQGSWGKRNNRRHTWLLATPLACLEGNALPHSEQTITGLIRTGATKTLG